uniref:Peptidyl-prolyl cis-trans isomerase n=1 Tax=Equus caballus TaxID=9796 RepID=F7D8B0_HORSE
MSVTLHTDVGDIKIEVFCERTPKTCENFLALCASNYYNGCIFHRNIKGFMVQTGDPTGTGRGGNSIWGKKFEDEYSEYLKHNVRGVVSMANNGPNTNGSQFFITYGKQPHLDMKYTVFGNFHPQAHLMVIMWAAQLQLEHLCSRQKGGGKAEGPCQLSQPLSKELSWKTQKLAVWLPL